MNRGHAFLQLVLARLREFYREPIAVFWVYGFPLILAFMLGLANMKTKVDPPTVDVVVVRDARDELLAVLKAQEVDATLHTLDDAQKRLRQAKTMLVVVDGEKAIEYIYDPTRPDSVNARYWVDSVLARSPLSARPLEDTQITAPGSRYIDFLLPGLVGINLMGGGLFGIGFVLVEMRVRKLFKRLMATPMRHGDFLLAMIGARLMLLVPEMCSLLILARWLFGVPVLGSYATLALVVLMGALTFAGIGLLLGCRTEKTETISGLVNLVMLPMYLVSGVFFSASRFPDVTQPFIQALPLTRLINALREVMLEGAGLADIRGHLFVLAAWTLVTFLLALRWFRWS
ncbi:MAG: ABC transporter permease [Planctomycetota bacterium]